MLWSLLLSSLCSAAMATTLFLRHGGQLSTVRPSMAVINDVEMSAAMALHAKTQYFHSDFAHTDYAAAPGNITAGGASFSSQPLVAPRTLQGSVRATLWIGTNEVETSFTVSLGRWTEASGWASLCGATANTLHREGTDTALPLPGKPMVAASSNGGFAVALPLEMALDEAIELQAGDQLRVDVSCGAGAGGPGDGDQERGGPGAGGPEGWTWQRVLPAVAPSPRAPSHCLLASPASLSPPPLPPAPSPSLCYLSPLCPPPQVWHNQKWASTVEMELGGEPLSLMFEEHPVITQPAAAM